jgi:hypothetical protein
MLIMTRVPLASAVGKGRHIRPAPWKNHNCRPDMHLTISNLAARIGPEIETDPKKLPDGEQTTRIAPSA